MFMTIRKTPAFLKKEISSVYANNREVQGKQINKGSTLKHGACASLHTDTDESSGEGRKEGL